MANGCIDDYTCWQNYPNLANAVFDEIRDVPASFFKVVDLSDLTANGSVDLTFALDQTGTPQGPPVPGTQVSFSPLAATEPHFVMTQTPASFRPRDARDTAADCTHHDGDCHPSFAASLIGVMRSEDADPPYTPLLTTFNFQLGLPSAANGKWLKGTSTNFTPVRQPPDDENSPDYIFEKTSAINQALGPPQNNGLAISTPAPVNPVFTPTTVTVTSRDFGGAAQLRATATLPGIANPIDLDVVDPDTSQPVSVPGGSCGADFAQHPFVSIPVDQDCDGIADSWQEQYASQTGGNGSFVHLPKEWDQEPGYAGNSPKGDGYSVHDEYRGFHYVLDDGRIQTAQWTFTDPVNKMDVFFWDPTNHYTIPLRNILSRQGTDAERAANDFKLVYRRVADVQANAKNPRVSTLGTRLLNKNSITTSSQQEGYAVTYVERPLPRTASRMDLGMASSLRNNGSPLYLDPGAINRFLSDPGAAGFPSATLTSQVVAHETGHLFGQSHPQRSGCSESAPCKFVSFSNTNQSPSLTSMQFAFLGVQPDNSGKLRSRTVYARLTQYQYNGLPRDADNFQSVAQIIDNGTGKRTEIPALTVNSKTIAVSGGNMPVFRLTLDGILDSGASVFMENQLQKIMDWTPYLNWTQLDQWRFDQYNLERLCVGKVCH
jgi:hypothetical protein